MRLLYVQSRLLTIYLGALSATEHVPIETLYFISVCSFDRRFSTFPLGFPSCGLRLSSQQAFHGRKAVPEAARLILVPSPPPARRIMPLILSVFIPMRLSAGLMKEVVSASFHMRTAPRSTPRRDQTQRFPRLHRAIAQTRPFEMPLHLYSK